MRMHIFGVTLMVCCLFACSATMAAESTPSIPNLVGTWVAVAQGHTVKARVQVTVEMQITEQNGAQFRGIRTWKHSGKPEAGLHAGGKLTTKASERIIGIIGFDNKTIYIAEHGDWGVQHCRLLDPDTMESIYVESGPHAVVGRTVYKRRK